MVVSIFVNPMQFGPGEDLDRYPRTFEADLEVCAEQGVDVVFAPSVDEVYPGGDPQVTVEPGPLATVLEGASGPATSAACSPWSPSSSAWSGPTSRCSARRTTSSSS